MLVRNRTWASRLFEAMNYSFLSGFALITIAPFIYVVLTSFSATNAVIPTQFSLGAYRFLFSTPAVLNSLKISVGVTAASTLLSLAFTSLTAYPLAKKDLLGRRAVIMIVLFTMLFSGGMIPTYFVVRWTGLLNTYWALMIPSLISVFYLIVMKNFFQSIPDEITDAARIDGCHELGVLFRIVLPLSKPALAAFGLFYAVAQWNQYFAAVIYLSKAEMWPIQVILRQIVILATRSEGDAGMDDTAYQGQAVRMAVIVVAALPILMLYPFLQKHFAKGVMLGSVKG